MIPPQQIRFVIQCAASVIQTAADMLARLLAFALEGQPIERDVAEIVNELVTLRERMESAARTPFTGC